MVQATRRSRKQRTEAAIAHALARRWDEAAQGNRELLEQQPDDLEAANRLGKALTELGDVKAGIRAYQRSLEIDPANAIARKNLVKLEAATSTGRAKDAKSRKPAAGDAIRTDALIDESGKSAVFGLHKPNRRALKRLSTGDPVQLQLSENGVNVKSSTRAVLGHLDPRGAQRLHRLIEGGNRYEAAIRHIGDEDVTILVRETYRDPSLLDEPSFFPPSAAERRRSAPRAYARASMLHRGEGAVVNSDEEEADEPDVWRASAAATTTDELEQAGFGKKSADDEDAPDGEDGLDGDEQR